MTRARSSGLSLVSRWRSGASTWWSIPAAIRSPLWVVVCNSTARQPSCAWYSPTSELPSSAAARGSWAAAPGSGSLATSSDWTTTVVGPSTGSTVHSIAATARCTNDTSRVEVTRTRAPAGEVQSAVRRSTPSRMSSVRSWPWSTP